MTSDELFERHLRPLREKHGADLWRVLARLVERQIWTMPADLFQAYQADPARAEADLLPKYRIVYLARHAVAALPRAVAERRRAVEGGKKGGAAVSRQSLETLRLIEAEVQRQRDAGIPARQITKRTAQALDFPVDSVRKGRKRIESGKKLVTRR